MLSPNGFQLYVGTPHNFYTIYAKESRTEIGEEREFLKGFKRLEVPVINDNGKSAWEEKYPLQAMDKVRLKTGVNKFESQMLLKPSNIAEGVGRKSDKELWQFISIAFGSLAEIETQYFIAIRLEYIENNKKILTLMNDEKKLFLGFRNYIKNKN